jgi:hypothetical protein
MRKIIPYKTLRFAKSVLDNGGRFYNLLTQADDNLISSPELAKAAGVFAANTNAVLFLEMVLVDLPSKERVKVLSMLAPDLMQVYSANKPMTLAPSVVETKGRLGKSTIVAGYPRFVENKEQFGGIVLIPIYTGKSITFTVIPLVDRFDVYEVFDTPKMLLPRTVIATLRGSQRMAEDRCTRFGGVLKKITFEDKTNKQHSLYLDTLYYTQLS